MMRRPYCAAADGKNKECFQERQGQLDSDVCRDEKGMSLFTLSEQLLKRGIWDRLISKDRGS